MFLKIGWGVIMIDAFIKIFSYSFLTRAFFVGLLVALCSSLIGIILVLKNYSMIGDGLSHVGFGALSVATFFHISPLLFSIPTMIVSSFFLLKMNRDKMRGDSSIALVSMSALAIGILFSSFQSGMNINLSNYLFGSILAVSTSDLIVCIFISLGILFFFFKYYFTIFSITFDPDFAKATGVKVERYYVLFSLFTALIIAVGMRIMGTLLISSLIVFPPLTAMQYFKSFRKVVISSSILSICAFILGMLFSCMWDFPVGASIVMIHLLFFLFFKFLSWKRGNL